MNKNRIFNEKGITLIALVVSIIVLLILAGVSIAVLTGENGLLNRATSAKQTHEEKTAEEELRLGVSALTIDYRKNTTNATSFRDYVMANTQALANAMGVDANELSMDIDNYAVTYKGQTYTITDDGKLEPFVLVPLTAFSIVEESLEVAEGETKKLTIQKTPSNANERIVWTSSDNTIATVDANGNVTGVKNGTQTATISAVSKSGNVSSSTSCAVTVTKSLGYFKTENGVAKYYPSPSATTGTIIDKNNIGNYLGMKVNYTPDGYLTDSNNATVGTSTTYRLFYIDIATDAHPSGNYYGDGLGTIYLKADCDANSAAVKDLPDTSKTIEETKMRQFNKMWWNDTTNCRNESFKDYNNRLSVNKMLDSSIWSVYKDTTKSGQSKIANYVIGGPSLEMWVDSYNVFLIKNPPELGTFDQYNYTTETGLNGTYSINTGAGYFVGKGGSYASNGNLTANNSIVDSLNYTEGSASRDRVKAWNSGSKAYWLASPCANNANYLVDVRGSTSNINNDSYSNNYVVFCPLVCCNSGVAISEAE